LFQFNYFYNNWLDPTNIFQEGNVLESNEIFLDINLPEDFFKTLQFTRQAIKDYKINAAVEAYKALGSKPALCFSGGVDSQVMLQCFILAEIDIDVYCLVFKNNLNVQDVSAAREYCKKFNIELKEIEIDIKKFLQRENFDYGIKYKSASPHFNTHYKLFNYLKSIGHTGICAGGDTAYRVNNVWGNNITRNPLNFINYSQEENFPVIGNFLSYYPQLSWLISVFTKPCTPVPFNYGGNNWAASDEQKWRYHDKINGYLRAGFNITAQPKKFTGFELVKLEYEYMTNDPLEFEKRFRKPLEDILKPIMNGSQYKLTEDQLYELHMLQSNNFTGSVFFSKFGLIQDSFCQNPFYFDDTRAWG
jgi:hypothetical protein